MIEDPAPLIALFAEFSIANLPSIFLLVGVALLIITIVLSALIGIIMFLGGMLSGRYFSISFNVAFSFAAYVLLYLITGIFGLIELVQTIESGIMLGLIAGGAGLVAGFIFNAIYSISHLAKFKSIFKIITAIGITAGMAMMILFFPFELAEGAGPYSTLLVIIGSFMGLEEAGKTILDLFMDPEFIAVFLYTLGGMLGIFYLFYSTAKSAAATAVVFGHSRKKEKNMFVVALITLLIAAVIIAPFFIIAVGEGISPLDFAEVFKNEAGETPTLYFAAGAIILFISAIFNSFVCEKRKRKKNFY